MEIITHGLGGNGILGRSVYTRYLQQEKRHLNPGIGVIKT